MTFTPLPLKNKIWQHVDLQGKAKKKKKDENPNLKCLSTPTHVLIHHFQPPNSEKCFCIAHQFSQ